MKVYQRLARLLDARQNCIESGNPEWQRSHEQAIEELAENYLPHGSGFDAGTTVDLERSREDRIVLQASYHHMNENGFYVGWTDHDIIITPSLTFDYNLRITGRDRNQTRDYIIDQFCYHLDLEV